MRAVIVILLAFTAGASAAARDTIFQGYAQLGPTKLTLAGWVTDDGAAVNLPDVGLFNVTFDLTEQDGAFSLESRDRRAPLQFDGSRDGNAIEGTWTAGDLSGPFRLDTKSGAIPYTQRDLTFQSGPLALAGTLVLPDGDGPFPAVVWTHGSGAIGRGSTTYTREAYLLATHGIASFVYDKRGVGDSEGDWKTATFHDLARDALAAARALRDQPAIDPDRTGIGGLSQGPSWIIPLAFDLANEPRPFEFIVALSPSVVTAAEQHITVITNRLLKQGEDETTIARATELARAVNEFQRTGEGQAALESRLGQCRDEPWRQTALLPVPPLQRWPQSMLDWMYIDPQASWRRIDVPVLALFGAEDALVNTSRSAGVLNEILGDQLTTRTFPGADHELVVRNGPFPMLAPGRNDVIVRWVNEVTRRTSDR